MTVPEDIIPPLLAVLLIPVTPSIYNNLTC